MFKKYVNQVDRLDGLIVRGNTIIQTTTEKQQYPDAFMFDLENCKNVEIYKNSYKGDCKNILKADEVSKETLTFKRNKGLKVKK